MRYCFDDWIEFFIDYKLDTRVLITSAFKEHLNTVETVLDEKRMDFHRIKPVLDYAEMSDIIDDSGTYLTVYLVQTEDLEGEQIIRRGEAFGNNFLDFDTVDVIFKLKTYGLIVDRIKENGRYFPVHRRRK